MPRCCADSRQESPADVHTTTLRTVRSRRSQTQSPDPIQCRLVSFVDRARVSAPVRSRSSFLLPLLRFLRVGIPVEVITDSGAEPSNSSRPQSCSSTGRPAAKNASKTRHEPSRRSRSSTTDRGPVRGASACRPESRHTCAASFKSMEETRPTSRVSAGSPVRSRVIRLGRGKPRRWLRRRRRFSRPFEETRRADLPRSPGGFGSSAWCRPRRVQSAQGRI